MGYIFIRNLLYKSLYDANKPFKPTNDLTTREKGVIAAIAGGTAAFVTTPFELINTRIVADGGIYREHRRNYKGLGDAWGRIIAEEGGNRGLFKGGLANIIRAVVLNVSLTGPYDYLNEKGWITFGDFGFVKPFAIVWAAFWGSIFTLPVDNIKTKLMKQFNDGSKNRISYNGIFDVVTKSLEVEGYLGLWAGFFPFYARTLLYCFFTVYAMDEITSNWKR